MDALVGEKREELIVAVDMLAEAMDKDDFGFDGASGLGWKSVFSLSLFLANTTKKNRRILTVHVLV